MTTFEARAKFSDRVLRELAEAVSTNLGPDRDRILREDTCIYVVGSGGRGEMSEHSDVDLFVARNDRPASDIDAFSVRQAIARALYARNLPDPSQGGEFLKMHTARSLCERLGTPEDDATNTFTARMLLLLESRPLLGETAYVELIGRIVNAYWKNAQGHEADYQPFVLVNDVVRYWRILLLNYVAKNAEKELELNEAKREPEWRLRSYKLRFSRCITCFSVLAKLLAVTAGGAVKRDHVIGIVRERPCDRLRGIAELAPAAASRVTGLLTQYETFLETTAAPKPDLIASFAEAGFRASRAEAARNFGDGMFELLQELGSAGRARELFRHIVV